MNRKTRSDAERNRQRLLEVAKESFSNYGPDTSLEEIARQAGVGIGTLYRNFPTRAALVEAVYKGVLEELGDAAVVLAEQEKPLIALHKWMTLYVDYLVADKILAEIFRRQTGDASNLYITTGHILLNAIELLTKRAILSGEIILEIEPLDLLRAVTGIVNICPSPNWESNAHKMVEIVLKGIQST